MITSFLFPFLPMSKVGERYIFLNTSWSS